MCNSSCIPTKSNEFIIYSYLETLPVTPQRRRQWPGDRFWEAFCLLSGLGKGDILDLSAFWGGEIGPHSLKLFPGHGRGQKSWRSGPAADAKESHSNRDARPTSRGDAR
jgi:hypothetical protein